VEKHDWLAVSVAVLSVMKPRARTNRSGVESHARSLNESRNPDKQDRIVSSKNRRLEWF
jgi:hypothetical protein